MMNVVRARFGQTCSWTICYLWDMTDLLPHYGYKHDACVSAWRLSEFVCGLVMALSTLFVTCVASRGQE